METLIDEQDPVTIEILRQEPDVKMKMIELLVRIRKGCCDGSMNIEVDDNTSIPLGFLQKRGLITGTLSIWVSNNLYCSLTDKGKKVLREIGQI